MEEPYITQDVNGHFFFFRIKLWFSHYKYQHHKSLVLQHKGAIKMAVKKLRLDTITTTAAQKTHQGWVGGAG